jgi:cyclophilin family peptidyl-prolyl cis-trans isomerase
MPHAPSRLVALLSCSLLLAGCSESTPESKQAAKAAVQQALADGQDAGGAAPAPAAPASSPAKDADMPAATPAAADAAVAQIDAFIKDKAVDTTTSGWRTRLPAPPKAGFTAGKSYFWDLKTNKGDIRVKLMPDVAPMHVSSTIYLTRLGFYDTLGFHRVITGFMAQGGCPLGTGTGSPGFRYAGEFSPTVRHDRPGLLSMANAGPNTDGSQFFLTFVPTPHLDGKHTIFGEVVAGMDVVKQLEANGSSSGKTKVPLLIERATIAVE